MWRWILGLGRAMLTRLARTGSQRRPPSGEHMFSLPSRRPGCRVSTAYRIIAFLVASTAGSMALALDFEDRVNAHMAIERIYYDHQIGASTPFEEAVSRELVEAKIHEYLKMGLALKELWATPVTEEMLAAETRRILRRTRMPERLAEIFAALGNDPYLIQECVARPTLVNRLLRNFFSFDEAIHGSARDEALRLRAELSDGVLSPFEIHPLRTMKYLVRRDSSGSESCSPQVDCVELDAEEFESRRKKLPRVVGYVGGVREDRDVFTFDVVLDEDAARIRMASYRVRKIGLSRWWRDVESQFDESRLVIPSRAPFAPDPVHVPGASSGACVPDDTWSNGSLDDAPDGRFGFTAVWTGSVMLIWGGSQGVEKGEIYDPITDTWSKMSLVDAPALRHEHTAVWTGSELIVWGGNGTLSEPLLDTGGRYNPLSDSWLPTTTVGSPVPRRYHTAVWTGAEMVVWGGFDGANSALHSGGRYDPDSDSWLSTSLVDAPAARRYHSAVWAGDVMIVYGGELSFPLNRTGGKYDPTTNTWTPTSTLSAKGHKYHSAVWTGEEMIVWGGHSEGGNWSNNGERYDPIADTWTLVSVTNAPAARRFHTGVWTGQEMIVWGGENNDLLDTGGRYDPSSDSWLPTGTVNAPTPRRQHGAVWTGDRMIVWGPTVNTGGRYDPLTDTWTPTSSGSAPTARVEHSGVWTGSQFIVWGGAFLDVNTGGRYDPALDHWAPTTTIGAPSGRRGHTAVWTGNSMIVWGGRAGILSFSTGGVYDPISDDWVPTTTTGAPDARVSHTAVWSGEEMIVWGGESWDNQWFLVDSGARYNLIADSWTPLPSLDSAGPRIDATAVWADDRMLIWGGYGEAEFPEEGAGYVPATDSWSPMSTVDSPSGRTGHSAIWTGEEMIIWGGNTGTQSGARYDPEADQWTAVGVVGAPSNRTRHSAVWTGSEMVVWGGYSGGFFDTGGRYDPVSDSWTSTATLDAPAARHLHTAAWTGSHMLIWGGSGPSPLNSGGRYALYHTVDNDGDGFSECDGDCNDGDAASYPGADEVCDGLDNDCSGIVDEGFTVPGFVMGVELGTDGLIAWIPEPVSERYDVVKGDVLVLISSNGDYEASLIECLEHDLIDPSTFDGEVPPSGSGFYYLVRGERNCRSGSYSTGSTVEVPGRDEEIGASAVGCP